MTYYFDMDGVLANFHKEKFNFRNAINRAWIASLEPFQENVNLINSLIENGEAVYILTKAAHKNAMLGKIDWLAKYVPGLDMEHFICIVGQGKKVDYIKEDGILIDDDMKNLRPWAKAGHATYYVEIKGAAVHF